MLERVFSTSFKSGLVGNDDIVNADVNDDDNGGDDDDNGLSFPDVADDDIDTGADVVGFGTGTRDKLTGGADDEFNDAAF